MHAQGLHGVSSLGSRDPQAAAVNRIYPTGVRVEKNRLAQPFLAMCGCIGHDVKAVLHRENARREHSAVCQLQRSRDRKVLAKRGCSRRRTCGFTAGSSHVTGARSARVYLPAGVRWQQLLIAGGQEGEKAGAASYTLGDVFEGGQEITIDAPLECIPVFVRENTELGSC